MDDFERHALENLRFDWAPTRDNVWAPAQAHVEGLNDKILHAVMAAFDEAKASQVGNPLGVVITGQQGSGKTPCSARCVPRYNAVAAISF